LGSSYSELLSTNRSFEKPQLWGAAWGTSFRTQLWGAAFSSNFADHLLGATLENSFGELLWGTGLKHSNFGATTLQRCFGEQLWKAASGNRFGEHNFGQLFGTTLPNNYFEEQLWGAVFGGSFTDNFGEKLSVPILGRSFREPLSRMGLRSRFGEQVCRIAALGQQPWRTALGLSFGEQRRGTGLGSKFASLPRH